jgi:hypothetical protein
MAYSIQWGEYGCHPAQTADSSSCKTMSTAVLTATCTDMV